MLTSLSITQEKERANDIREYEKDIHYSTRYSDEEHEYRHVVLVCGRAVCSNPVPSFAALYNIRG